MPHYTQDEVNRIVQEAVYRALIELEEKQSIEEAYSDRILELVKKADRKFHQTWLLSMCKKVPAILIGLALFIATLSATAIYFVKLAIVESTNKWIENTVVQQTKSLETFVADQKNTISTQVNNELESAENQIANGAGAAQDRILRNCLEEIQKMASAQAEFNRIKEELTSTVGEAEQINKKLQQAVATKENVKNILAEIEKEQDKFSSLKQLLDNPNFGKLSDELNHRITNAMTDIQTIQENPEKLPWYVKWTKKLTAIESAQATMISDNDQSENKLEEAKLSIELLRTNLSSLKDELGARKQQLDQLQDAFIKLSENVTVATVLDRSCSRGGIVYDHAERHGFFKAETPEEVQDTDNLAGMVVMFRQAGKNGIWQTMEKSMENSHTTWINSNHFGAYSGSRVHDGQQLRFLFLKRGFNHGLQTVAAAP